MGSTSRHRIRKTAWNLVDRGTVDPTVIPFHVSSTREGKSS